MNDSKTHVFDTIVSTAKSRKNPVKPFLIYLSGIDASGKTKLAIELCNYLKKSGEDVQLIHLDDFHFPKAFRYSGNKDESYKYYERSFDLNRLKEEVLLPIKTSLKLKKTLALLDLASDKYIVKRKYNVTAETIVVVEGVFLGRSELMGFCDMFIQINVSFTTAFERAKKRDVPLQGEDVINKYASKYYPAQLRYLKNYNPTSTADFIIENEDYNNPQIYSNGSYLSKESDISIQQTSNNVEQFLINKNSNRNSHIEAVIFDFWNTLVRLRKETKEQTFLTSARVLGINPNRLRPLWIKSRKNRETSDLITFLIEFCSTIGIDEPIKYAKEIIKNRMLMHGNELKKLEIGAELTIRMIKSAGYKTGLISNCTSDVPLMLQKNVLNKLLDVKTFSCYVGVLKPDREIFLQASNNLGIPPQKCLYIGDGNDNELTGALSAGMLPILFVTEYKRDWNGVKIQNLFDIVPPLIN